MCDNDNMDRLCAFYGHEISENVSKVIGKNAKTQITKSLGVLQEDGVYAFFLYSASQAKHVSEPLETSCKPESELKPQEKAAAILSYQAAKLLCNENVVLLRLNEDMKLHDILAEIRKPDGLADNLDNLLLAKRLLEQTLVYARYHAEALEV